MCSPLKKARIEPTVSIPSTPQMRVFLNGSMCSEVLKYLNFKDIIRFENTSKQFSPLRKWAKGKVSPVTELGWKLIAIRDKLNFTWSDCEKEIQKNKWNYILGNFFCNYALNHTLKYSDRKGFIKDSKDEYAFLIGRFSILGSFLIKDFRCLVRNSLSKPLSKRLLQASTTHGGEASFLILIELRKKKPENMKEPFNSALTKGATVIGFLALTVRRFEKKFGIEIALECAKRGDFRALEHILINHRNYIEKNHLINKKIPEDLEKTKYPPILHHKSQLTDNFKERERLLEEALEAYKDQKTINLLADLALVKFELKKYDEAEVYIKEALQLIQNDHRNWGLPLNGNLALTLLSKKMIDICTELYCLEFLYFVKITGGDYLKAESIFEQVWNSDATSRIVYDGIVLKLCLGKYHEVEQMLDSAADKLHTSSKDFLFLRALVKLLLNKPEWLQMMLKLYAPPYNCGPFDITALKLILLNSQSSQFRVPEQGVLGINPFDAELIHRRATLISQAGFALNSIEIEYNRQATIQLNMLLEDLTKSMQT